MGCFCLPYYSKSKRIGNSYEYFWDGFDKSLFQQKKAIQLKEFFLSKEAQKIYVMNYAKYFLSKRNTFSDKSYSLKNLLKKHFQNSKGVEPSDFLKKEFGK